MRVVPSQRTRLATNLDGAVVGPLGDGVDPRGAEGLVGRVAPLEALRLDLSVVVEVGKLAPLPLYGQAIFWTVIVGQCPFVSIEGRSCRLTVVAAEDTQNTHHGEQNDEQPQEHDGCRCCHLGVPRVTQCRESVGA